MHILVTGSNGFLGKNLIQKLKEQDQIELRRMMQKKYLFIMIKELEMQFNFLSILLILIKCVKMLIL